MPLVQHKGSIPLDKRRKSPGTRLQVSPVSVTSCLLIIAWAAYAPFKKVFRKTVSFLDARLPLSVLVPFPVCWTRAVTGSPPCVHVSPQTKGKWQNYWSSDLPSWSINEKHQAPVVQKLDNTEQWINHFPEEKELGKSISFSTEQ